MRNSTECETETKRDRTNARNLRMENQRDINVGTICLKITIQYVADR